MGIFKKNKAGRIVTIIIITLILVTAGYFIHKNQTRIEAAVTTENGELTSIAVVDYEKLLREHPDYSKLEKLNQEIYMIAPPDLDPERIKKIHSGLSDRLEKYKEQVEKTLEAERDRIQADSNARVKKLHDQVEAQFKEKQKDFEKYRDQLEKDYQTSSEDPDRPLTPYEKEFHQRLAKYSGDLIALKDRQVMAKDLELRKKSQAKLQAEENRLSKVLSDYEDELRKEHQNDKLNLQLKMQVAKDDQEREELQKQLSAIFEEEQKLVTAKRKELADEFAKLEDAETASNKKALDEYRKTLEKDVNSQLSDVQKKVAQELQQEGLSRGDDAPHVPRELRDKLEARHKQLTREMEQLEDKIKPQIRQIEKEAEEQFNRRKDQLIKQLQEYQKALDTEFQEKSKVIVGELETATLEAQKTRDKLIAQRKNLIERMSEEINQEVAKVAREENLGLVLGEYEVNLNARDISDLAQPAVRNISRKSE